MNFESVRSIIDTYIKKNGVEAITGDILNNVLNTMLDDVDTAISSIEPSPGGGSGEGGVSEEDVLDILEKNNYITSSALSSYYTKAQSDARYLSVSGGTITGELRINPSNTYGSFYVFNADDTYRLTHLWDGNIARLYNIKNDGSSYGILNLQGTIQINDYTAIHSGNIGSYKAGGLATPRTIWGQSFDGTGDVLAMNGVGLMSSKSYYYGLSILPMGSPYWGVRTFLTYDQGSTMGAYEIASRNAYGLTISHSGGVAYDFGNIPSDLSYDVLVNIRPNGNVGIGTTSPACKLDVNGTIRNKGIIINRATDNAQAYCITEGSSESLEIRTAGGSVPIVFNTNYNGAGERMRIAGNGNVLIGTTTDSGYKLDVNGEVRATTFRFYDDYRSRITLNGPYIDIISAGNEMVIGTHSGDTTMYINYRNSTGGGTAKTYIWNAGSPSSWADFYMGNTTINGNLVVSGDVASA